MPENVLLSVATLLAIALAGVLSVVLARWLRIHPAWFFIFIGSLLPYFWPQAFATKNLVGQLAEIGALFLVFLAALDIPWELRLTLRPREAARLLLQYFASMLPLFVFFYFLVLPGEMAAAFGATLLAGAFVPPSRQHSVEAGFRSYPQQEKPALRGVLSESTVLVALGFLLPLSQRTFTGAEVLRQMVALLILLVAMLYLIPQVLRLILRRTGEESYALFYSTIALIFITIAAGYFLGLEPMLGAYAVGFIISRFVAQGSRILGRLRFIGLSFFVPAFYMEFGSTGMLWQGLAWQMVLPVLLLTAAVIAVRSFQRYAFGWENTETAKTLLRIQRNPMVLALLYFAFVHGLLPLSAVQVLFWHMLLCEVLLVTFYSPPEKSAEPAAPAVPRVLLPLSNPETMLPLMNLATHLGDEERQPKLYPLNVVADTPDAESRIRAMELYFQEIIPMYTARGQPVELMARIGNERAPIVAQAARELLCDRILLGLGVIPTLSRPQGYSFLEELGRLVTDKTLLAAHLSVDLALTERINVIIPHPRVLASLRIWLPILFILANRLKAELFFFSDSAALVPIQAWLEQNGKKANLRAGKIPAGLDLLSLDSGYNGIAVAVLSRAALFPSETVHARMPEMLLRAYSDKNFILLYPPMAATEIPQPSRWQKLKRWLGF